MASLTEEQREKLRTKTVEFLLDVRAAYLATPGCSPLKHWDQIQNRMLSAARRSANAEEWATSLLRGLQIPTLNSSGSSSLHDLCAAVKELSATFEWFDLIIREYGLIMATTRLAADAARAAKKDREMQ